MTVTASEPLLFLEFFRTPYSVDEQWDANGVGRVVGEGGAELLWPTHVEDAPAVVAGVPIAAPVASSDSAAKLLAKVGGRWAPDGAFWRSSDGRIFVPFDPNRAVSTLLTESYAVSASVAGGSAATAARSMFYRVRPLLPRALQLGFRRQFRRLQERAAFPRWPVETALHDLYAVLFRLIDAIATRPLPRIAPWPDDRSWAVVLTHDVETSAGYQNLEPVIELERRHGRRSAWYFVPERDYVVDDDVVRTLDADGFEVGVHGLHHDGRDLSPRSFEARLSSIRAYANRWGAVGFRSPATHRSWTLMPRLGFDYDTSYTDVARYEPQPGGCCSWLPFFIDDLVELPMTLPMDHTLFELLGHRDGGVWHEKAALLRDRAGMALMLTHPDYMLDASRLAAYEKFVAEYSADETAWHALPRDVSAWWRRRASSRIERERSEWRVVGPAASEARIEVGPIDATAEVERAL